MLRYIRLMSLATLTACSASVLAEANDLAAFPAAPAGFERKVIRLPDVAQPELYRVQLLPGKVVKADCNTRGLQMRLRESTVRGWGYNYWTVSTLRMGPSTLMACPEPASERLVQAQSELLRYNPRLPLVVYVPQGSELHYKVWRAPEASEKAVSQ